MSAIKTCYVRTNYGATYVQRPADNHWGFEIADDDRVWPGGLGLGTSWEAVDEAEVSPEDRARLGWLLELGAES